MRHRPSPQPPAVEPQEPLDPLLAKLARVEAQAKRIGRAKGPVTAERRKETLVTLADLGFLLQTLRSAQDSMRPEVDGTLAARHVTHAYRQANALSRIAPPRA